MTGLRFQGYVTEGCSAPVGNLLFSILNMYNVYACVYIYLHIIPYNIYLYMSNAISFDITSCHDTISHQITFKPYHLTPYRIMLCHTISDHIIAYHHRTISRKCICISNIFYIYNTESTIPYSIWQRPKNIGLVTGLGGRFATRLVTESGGLATNPPCDKPIEDIDDCSTLHRGPRQGFVTEGPRQKIYDRTGGPRQTPISGPHPCSIFNIAHLILNTVQ